MRSFLGSSLLLLFKTCSYFPYYYRHTEINYSFSHCSLVEPQTQINRFMQSCPASSHICKCGNLKGSLITLLPASFVAFSTQYTGLQSALTLFLGIECSDSGYGSAETIGSYVQDGEVTSLN